MNDPPLKIVHATDRFVVIDKPAGLLSVPGKGEANQDCVPARLREMFPNATGPLVVHRLDMDTSGLLVLGLDPQSQRDLSAQFETRQVEKRYTALVDGVVSAESGAVDLPLRPDFTNRPYQIVDHELGRPAQTKWRLTAIEIDRSRLELTPITGRTHQLRVHCAAPAPAGLGHPILGDVLYAPQPPAGHTTPRLMLHASFLSFLDPQSGKRTAFESPPPF